MRAVAAMNLAAVGGSGLGADISAHAVEAAMKGPGAAVQAKTGEGDKEEPGENAESHRFISAAAIAALRISLAGAPVADNGAKVGKG